MASGAFEAYLEEGQGEDLEEDHVGDHVAAFPLDAGRIVEED